MMCYRQDLHLPLHLSKENREGKSPEISPSNIRLAVNRITLRILADLLQCPFELRQIPGTEPGHASLVPGNRLEVFRFRRRMEPIHHRSKARALRLTSSAAVGCTSPRSSSPARRFASESQVSASSSSDTSSRLNRSLCASSARSSGGNSRAASCSDLALTMLSFTEPRYRASQFATALPGPTAGHDSRSLRLATKFPGTFR